MTESSGKKALLVLDMSKIYVYGEKPLIDVGKRVTLIANIRKAVSSAHKRSIPVIYVDSAFRDTDPIYVKYINYRDQAKEGAENNKVIDELQPQKQDYVLVKRGFDGFWESGLDALLKRLGIESIYLTGCQTDCCVRETAVTAAHIGYDVYVIEDCCDTSREFGHLAAIRFMRTCTRDIIHLDQFVHP